MGNAAAAQRVPSSGRVGSDSCAPLALKGSASLPGTQEEEEEEGRVVGSLAARARGRGGPPRGAPAPQTTRQTGWRVFLIFFFHFFFLFLFFICLVAVLPARFKWRCLKIKEDNKKGVWGVLGVSNNNIVFFFFLLHFCVITLKNLQSLTFS